VTTTPRPPHDDAAAFDRRLFLRTAAGGAAAGLAGTVFAARAAHAQEPSPEPSATGEPPPSGGDETVDNLVVRGPRPWRDVTGFGADPSGGSDSTGPIQEALDAAAAEGGVVLVPAGTFVISARLVVPAGVTLAGTSRTRSTIRMTQNAGLLRTGGERASISNLRLDGNADVVVEMDAIVVLHSRCRVEDVDVVSWGRWAVGVYSATRVPGDFFDPAAAEPDVTDVVVRNCRLVGTDGPRTEGSPHQYANQGGVYLGPGTADFVVQDCLLRASAGPPNTGNYSGVRADTAQRGLVSGNRIEGNGRVFDGIVSWGARRLTIVGNIVTAPHDDGATYRDNGAGQPSEDVLIANNEFYDCGTSGVLCPAGGPHRAIHVLNNVIEGTGLAGIRFGGAVLSSCSGNAIKDTAHYGIDVQGAGGGNDNPTTDSVISNNVIQSSGWSGIHVSPNCARIQVLSNAIKGAGANASGPTGHGIMTEAPETTMEANHVYECEGDGIKIQASAPFAVVVGNRVVRNALDGIYLPPGVNDAVVEANHVRANGAIGIDLYGQGARNQIVGNFVHSNGQTGIRCLMQNDGMVSTNSVMRNGAVPAGTSNTHGIRLYNSTRMVVGGNKVGDDQSSPTQAPQLREDGSSDHNTIVGNDFTPGARPLELSGPNSLVRDNKGFVKDNSGVATIPSGGTKVTVNHGLSATPSLKDIVITPTSDFGNGAFWVSGPTATQFTINLSGVKLPTGVGFSWRASIL
jgi:Right handed beta helix region/Pectate lyase superfamily protein